MSEAIKWTVIALLVLNVIANIIAIGKPREPITAGSTIFVLIFNTAIALAIFAYWE